MRVDLRDALAMVGVLVGFGIGGAPAGQRDYKGGDGGGVVREGRVQGLW